VIYEPQIAQWHFEKGTGNETVLRGAGATETLDAETPGLPAQGEGAAARGNVGLAAIGKQQFAVDRDLPQGEPAAAGTLAYLDAGALASLGVAR
jgi:hypothetical protein